MEKHFWLGAALLTGLLILVLGISWFITAAHMPAAELLEDASQAALQDDRQLAQTLVLQAQDRWQRYRSISAAVADHDPIEEADSLFAEIACHIQAGKNEELAACCARLSKLMQAIVQAQRPTWWNLL